MPRVWRLCNGEVANCGHSGRICWILREPGQVVSEMGNPEGYSVVHHIGACTSVVGWAQEVLAPGVAGVDDRPHSEAVLDLYHEDDDESYAIGQRQPLPEISFPPLDIATGIQDRVTGGVDDDDRAHPDVVCSVIGGALDIDHRRQVARPAPPLRQDLVDKTCSPV